MPKNEIFDPLIISGGRKQFAKPTGRAHNPVTHKKKGAGPATANNPLTTL